MLNHVSRRVGFFLAGFLISAHGCAKDSPGTGGSGGAGNGTGGISGGGGNGSGGTSGTGGGSGGRVGSGGTPGSGGGGGGTAAGGTGTGGSGAAGAAGGTAGTGAVSCASLPFCDDFQSGTASQPPNPQKWTVDLNGQGTVTIDGGVGHNSSQSLHVGANNGFHTMAMVKGTPVFPLPAGVLYGRAYMRLGGTLTNNHVVWIEAGSVMNDVNETRIGSNLGLLDVNLWPGDADHRATGFSLAPTVWNCIEFMFDNTAAETRVWLNGAELADLHVTGWSVPSYDAIRFGWELNAGTSEVWYDDVALGYSRIGCL